MQVILTRASPALLLLLFLFSVLIQSPVAVHAKIIVGRTVPNSGIYAVEGAQVKNGTDFWFNWMQENRGGTVTANDGTAQPLEMVTLNDASDVNNAETFYRAMSSAQGIAFLPKKLNITAPVTVAFGPWTTQVTQAAIDETKAAGVPFVFSGASVPAFYNAAVYPHAVGLLVQTSKRSGPCMRLFAQVHQVRTAAIVASSDSFQQTARNIILSQLSTLNISVVYNTSVDATATQFSSVIQDLVDVKPELLVLAMGPFTCTPFVQQLRLATYDLAVDAQIGPWQPNAIFVTNPATVNEMYQKLGWPARGVYAGGQWSPLLRFSDPIFGTTANFTNAYRARFNTVPTFLDAAAAAAGFVLVDALSRLPASPDNASIIAALRSTNISDSFFGPIRFLPSGELDQGGLCEQLLPVEGADVSLGAYELRPVAPEALAIEPSVYPARADAPELLLKWHRYSDGVAVAFVVLACIFIAVATGTGVFVAINSGSWVLKNMGYWLIWALLIGMTLMVCSVFTFTGKPTKHTCVAQIWVIDLGAVVILSVLCVRSWNSLQKYRGNHSGERENESLHLGIALGVLLTVSFVYNIVWSTVSPPKVRISKDKLNDGSYYIDCSHTNGIPWLATSAAWKFIFLCVTAVISIVTRALNDKHIEGRRVAWMLCLLLPVSIVLAATIPTTGGVYSIQYILKAGVLSLVPAYGIFMIIFGTLLYDLMVKRWRTPSPQGPSLTMSGHTASSDPDDINNTRA